MKLINSKTIAWGAGTLALSIMVFHGAMANDKPVKRVQSEREKVMAAQGLDVNGYAISNLPKKVNYQQQQAEQLAKIKSQPTSDWSLNSYTDEASGQNSKVLSVISKNSINLGFPYSGAQHGTLGIRNHPRFGFDAYLKIRSGQLLCSSYNGTDKILVRVDDGPVKTYGCSEAADYSSDILFFNNVAGLEAQLKGAKKAWVSVSIYQEGTKTFQFDVEGYDGSKL